MSPDALSRAAKAIDRQKKRIEKLERELAAANQLADEYRANWQETDRKLAAAQKTLTAVRNYPGVVEHIGTQLSNAIDAAITSAK